MVDEEANFALDVRHSAAVSAACLRPSPAGDRDCQGMVAEFNEAFRIPVLPSAELRRDPGLARQRLGLVVSEAPCARVWGVCCCHSAAANITTTLGAIGNSVVSPPHQRNCSGVARTARRAHACPQMTSAEAWGVGASLPPRSTTGGAKRVVTMTLPSARAALAPKEESCGRLWEPKKLAPAAARSRTHRPLQQRREATPQTIPAPAGRTTPVHVEELDAAAPSQVCAPPRRRVRRPWPGRSQCAARGGWGSRRSAVPIACAGPSLRMRSKHCCETRSALELRLVATIPALLAGSEGLGAATPQPTEACLLSARPLTPKRSRARLAPTHARAAPRRERPPVRLPILTELFFPGAASKIGSDVSSDNARTGWRPKLLRQAESGLCAKIGVGSACGVWENLKTEPKGPGRWTRSRMGAPPAHLAGFSQSSELGARTSATGALPCRGAGVSVPSGSGAPIVVQIRAL